MSRIIPDNDKTGRRTRLVLIRDKDGTIKPVHKTKDGYVQNEFNFTLDFYRVRKDKK